LLTDVIIIFCEQLDPPPKFLAEREKLWAKLKQERDEWLAAQVPQPIKVTLPDGKVVEAESWKTTPYQVACGIRSVYR
jgi:threonyl-tRNA synthetase